MALHNSIQSHKTISVHSSPVAYEEILGKIFKKCSVQPFFLWVPLFSHRGGKKTWRAKQFLSFGKNCRTVEGAALSSAGVRINVFDDIKAYGHGRHGYRPSSPQRLRLELWERLVVHHEQLLAVQLDVSGNNKGKQQIHTALALWDRLPSDTNYWWNKDASSDEDGSMQLNSRAGFWFCPMDTWRRCWYKIAKERNLRFGAGCTEIGHF